MMCMALYTVVMLQEFEIWSLALNFISFIISFHRLFATNFGHAVDACIYILEYIGIHFLSIAACV